MTIADKLRHEAIMLYDEFGLMLTKKADKPHYIPAKNELLRYVDESYFEETKQYNGRGQHTSAPDNSETILISYNRKTAQTCWLL